MQPYRKFEVQMGWMFRSCAPTATSVSAESARECWEGIKVREQDCSLVHDCDTGVMVAYLRSHLNRQ